MRGIVDLLNKTLLDTERVLFDGLITVAIEHFGTSRKEHEFVCNKTLQKRAILKKARPKRLATLANKPGPIVEEKPAYEERDFRVKVTH